MYPPDNFDVNHILFMNQNMPGADNAIPFNLGIPITIFLCDTIGCFTNYDQFVDYSGLRFFIIRELFEILTQAKFFNVSNGIQNIYQKRPL